MRRRLAVAALGLILGASARPAAAAVRDPSCASYGITERAGAVIYRLPWPFLKAGSDSVWTRLGPWRRRTDYAIDAVRGELRLLREPVPGETLWVSACRLLEPPPFEHQLITYRPLAAAAPSDSATPGTPAGFVRPATARNPAIAPSGAALTVSGNKSIAVDFGSAQDAFLRQSLDLTVSGALSPGVELTGVLSDRNTPLTAAGSTQDLQALDRVLIELKAPQGGVTLGDVNLTMNQGEFARLERRLQGARAEWGGRGFTGVAAAASASGEYFRLEFFGVEGQQGPYLLTDRNGLTGVAVVAGSEVVTLDGVRMTRGESADYSMDYERGRVTFSNRRSISTSSRITVEYQYTANRYHRNLAAAGGRWESHALYAFSQFLSEGDDRGRPLDVTLSPDDQQILAAAGDSASRAIAPGVTAGGGDYDSVRVAGGPLVYAFAGPDSGRFAVQFARVAAASGDYLDSTTVGGRTAYRYVGSGNGTYRVGRALPLPESHQLWSLGGGARLGAASVELEGAVSKHDLNTFSTLDDNHHLGGAGRATLKLEGATGGTLAGTVGVALTARAVGDRFAPFSRLERPFAEEDWGLPVGADLDHQRRVELSAFWTARGGGTLRASAGRIAVPGGYDALRRGLEWSRDGRVVTRGLWERADGRQPGVRYEDGGREHLRGELRWRLPWVEPGVRAESDQRRFASDTGRVGDRFREAAAELGSGHSLAWHALAGMALRRDAGAAPIGFLDQNETRTLRLELSSPESRWLGLVLGLQRRAVEPLANPQRSRSDLATVRLRGDDRARGINGLINLEITSEGENRRVRSLTYAGPGKGSYDSFGNFVGTGDYNLVVTVSSDLELLARAVASTRLSWQFGESEVWRGSRAEFDYESEARRPGALRGSDALVSPGAALSDLGLARGSVHQRLESEIAPGSRWSALRLRAERRVTADRSFENFSQTLDDRQLALRWRGRTGATVSVEAEAQLRRQAAGQAVTGGARYDRVLSDQGGTSQLVFAPDARLRAAAVAEATWSRPQGQSESTRTLKTGPDLGLSVGEHGRAEVTARRAFISGPPAVGLLPSADPAGAPRWEGTARFDYRLRESTTLNLSFSGRERPGRATQMTGRVELRAFF